MREAKFTKPITIALPPDIYDKVKAITDHERISMAEWLRKVTEEALKESERKGGNKL